MKFGDIDINTINNISENQHNLSNILSAVVLTLDMCGSVTDLTPEDFNLIKEELGRAIPILHKNQHMLSQIMEKNADSEINDDDFGSPDTAYESPS
jgi:hypothetical protein